MSGHTPGPWWISKPMQNSHVQFVRAEGPGSNRGAVAKIYTYRGMDAAAADAHLIAAAPDLLEAAKEAVNILGPISELLGDYGHEYAYQRAHSECVRLREVVARAEGKL